MNKNNINKKKLMIVAGLYLMGSSYALKASADPVEAESASITEEYNSLLDQVKALKQACDKAEERASRLAQESSEAREKLDELSGREDGHSKDLRSCRTEQAKLEKTVGGIEKSVDEAYSVWLTRLEVQLKDDLRLLGNKGNSDDVIGLRNHVKALLEQVQSALPAEY